MNQCLIKKNLSRRVILKSIFYSSPLLLSHFGLTGCAAFMPPENSPLKGPGLGERASRQNRLFGAAIQSQQLQDLSFARALCQEVNLLVPENELKWQFVHPQPDHFNFSGYRRIANFARDNHMAVRGHTLVWHYSNPAWLEPALTSQTAAEKILQTHIETVLRKTAPDIRNWDVVNEAVHPLSPRPDGLRPTLWLNALGPDYIALAFHMAHQANPGLTLVYNDYGTEHGDGAGHKKRHDILALLERCKKNQVPVDAFGLQSHLLCHVPLGGREFTRFLKDVRDLGLKIYVTELDVDLSHLSGQTDDKIHIAQNYVRTYLDMIQQDGAIDMLLCWGLSDRYSWLRQQNPGLEGTLPLDIGLNRTPLWESLRNSWLKAGDEPA